MSTLSGETDVTTVAELSELVTAQLSGGAAPDDRCVRVEVRRFGVGTGAGARPSTLQERGGGLVLLRPQRVLVRMLEIMGADQMITIRGQTEIRPEPEP